MGWDFYNSYQNTPDTHLFRKPLSPPRRLSRDLGQLLLQHDVVFQRIGVVLRLKP
jgi:hypothetical protein